MNFPIFYKRYAKREMSDYFGTQMTKTAEMNVR